MTITIQSTDKVTELDRVPVRLWEGVAEDGTKCKVFVHRVAVHKDQDATAFEAALMEMAQPQNRSYIDPRLIL